MGTVKKSELKKRIIAIEARRSKQPEAPRLTLGRDPKLQRIREARDKLLVEFLQSAGLDTRKIAALGEQHDAALKGVTDKYRAETIRRAGKKGTHYSSVMGQCKAILDAADETDSVSLPKPFLIWATPRSNILSDSQTAPSNSWAKFQISSSGNDSYKVSFYFLWTNPFGNGVFIDPFAFVIATGYLEADADRSYLTPKIVNASAEADFFFWQWWLPAPAPLLSASASLGGVSAIAEYFQTDSKSQSIAAGVKLDAGSFFVPSYSTAIFEVAVSVSFLSYEEGTALADFESGNFNVTCPLVAFSVVQSPF